MSQVLSKKDREELIDLLLVDLNDEIEKRGAKIGHLTFNFEANSDNAAYFTKLYNIEYESLKQIINTCISRDFLNFSSMSCQYDSLRLTEEGQGRAISVGAADHALPLSGSNIQIGTLNAHGPTQLGDNNTQNIEYVFNSIIDKIDSSDAPEEEKIEVRNLLGKFIAHPLTNTVLGAASAIISAKLGGM